MGFFVGVTGFICKEKHGQALREAVSKEEVMQEVDSRSAPWDLVCESRRNPIWISACDLLACHGPPRALRNFPFIFCGQVKTVPPEQLMVETDAPYLGFPGCRQGHSKPKQQVSFRHILPDNLIMSLTRRPMNKFSRIICNMFYVLHSSYLT